MQEYNTLTESQVYYRLGQLETELGEAQKQIAKLHADRDSDTEFVKRLVRILIFALIGLFLAAALLIAAGVFILLR